MGATVEPTVQTHMREAPVRKELLHHEPQRIPIHETADLRSPIWIEGQRGKLCDLAPGVFSPKELDSVAHLYWQPVNLEALIHLALFPGLQVRLPHDLKIFQS